ncbi:DUF1206 domain-containing protein [Jannaschia sp. M317]|uniref:DUF1206 domain-containing protein n=1 Tax=Jannaschia sp. M317 TaxID=2867011 RepID=UPI0021A91F55|nr:DUF1206 domain-containing protein [Jannaschia sp. M317]UWQ16649.1 DUF1206 domain-containing protein [Jannaschia sp. M317]
MSDYSWSIPVMRAGYAGRGVTYLAVAGLSLWAIWRGREAEGTSSTMETLSQSTWGVVILWLIGLGLLAYALWRVIDAVKDLEDYGTEAKGVVSRLGMLVTGTLHGALGVLAMIIALGRNSGGGGIPEMIGAVLSWPGGPLMVGFAALCTLGAGVYYGIKAWKRSYRDTLMGNPFTRKWDWALRAGVLAQAVMILVIGGLLLAAAFSGNSQEAGGLDSVFDWLKSQPFGNFLVILLCLGLLGFAFFCFVNAAYRIIPKVAHGALKPLSALIDAAS